MVTIENLLKQSFMFIKLWGKGKKLVNIVLLNTHLKSKHFEREIYEILISKLCSNETFPNEAIAFELTKFISHLLPLKNLIQCLVV